MNRDQRRRLETLEGRAQTIQQSHALDRLSDAEYMALHLEVLEEVDGPATTEKERAERLESARLSVETRHMETMDAIRYLLERSP